MSAAALESLQSLQRSFSLDAVEAPVADSDYVRWVGTSLSIAGVPLLVGEGELQEITHTQTEYAIFPNET